MPRSCRSCSRKSSSENASSRIFRTSSSAFSAATVSWPARRATARPPCRRGGRRDGRGGRARARRPSRPRHERDGAAGDVADRERGAPRESPSSLARIIASTPTAAWNFSATVTASCPAIASTRARRGARDPGLDRPELVEHRLVDVEAAGGVEDDGAQATLARLADRRGADVDGRLARLARHRDAELAAERAELVDRRGR